MIDEWFAAHHECFNWIPVCTGMTHRKRCVSESLLIDLSLRKNEGALSFPRKRESSNKLALAMNRVLLIAAVLLTINIAVAQIPSLPTYVSTAVADPSRPKADRDRDADRKPTEVINFAGIKPGDKVADLMPGRGYFTRIFCKLVGEPGHVYAITVPRHGASSSSATTSSSASANAACSNVTGITLKPKSRPAPELHSDSDDPGWVYEYYQLRPAAESFAAPEPLDVIWTSENYHDLHNAAFGPPDMQLVNRALFNALRPGGVLIIEDHAAEKKSGARDTQTLHRIDPELVKQEVQSAGFIFVGESTVLQHPEDAHNTKAHGMHDKTDRFLFKFRKP